MEETWKSLVFQARWQNNSFRVLILAKQGSLQLENNLIVKPFLESEQNVSSTRSHHSQGHLSDGCYNTLMFSDTRTHKKWSPRHQRGQWPGQKRKCRQPVWGWDHLKKCSEAKPVSGEGFWLVKSRINDKETAISMISNIPLKYAINRFALGRARTKDEHKTAGKMQKSPSHCAGRWSYLVNPLQSSLGNK